MRAADLTSNRPAVGRRVVLVGVLLVVGAGVYFGFRSLVGTWARVQVLETPDGSRVATLERLYGYIDVNFRVKLDGRTIHRSWDCAPNRSLPFRETLAWDTTGDILVFELAGDKVFAFDIRSNTELPPDRFASIELPEVTLKDIGFEGRDALRSSTSSE